MKKLLLLCVIFASHLLYAQRVYNLDDDKAYADSLTTLVNSTKLDSLKCINSFKLADLYRRNKEAELSNKYFALANDIAPRYAFLKDIAIYYNASLYLNKGDLNGYENQIILANKRLKKYDVKPSYALRAYIIKNLTILQQIKNNEKEAMRMLVEEAMPLAVKGGDYEIISGIYKSLAIIFMNNNDRNKAHEYLKKAIENIKKATRTSPTYKEVVVETNIINAENLCELKRLPEAKISLDIAGQILKKYPDSNLNASFYFAQGSYFYRLNQHENAIKSFDKGITNSTMYQDIYLLRRLEFAKYLPLTKLHRYEEAKNMLQDLVDNNILFDVDQKNYTKELALTYERLGDIKNAYKYITRYITINDTLNETAFREKIAGLEAKFNKSENEKKIDQLEAQREKDALIVKNNELYYGLLGAITFILLLLVISLWMNSRSQKKLAVEHAKNYNQSLTSLKNQKEIEVMQAMIKGEEAERKRIARDLHDGVGSMLSSLKMRFVKVNNSFESINTSEIENMNTLLNTSIIELRQVSYNLIPESLLKLGLEHALSDLCHTLKTDNIHIDCHFNNISDAIPESIQITIYRIVQELMNNALKHSQGTEILLDCSQNENLFFITVEDNGKGFDTGKISEFSGLGLKNLNNRIALLNGKMEIDSSNENGTAFNIELTI